MGFFKEYLKNPLRIGAVAPSSRFLAAKMMREADFESCGCVVEYGPGTGVFTREIVRRKKPDTPFLAIEQNPAFVGRLEGMFAGDDSVHIIQGSAANVRKILSEYGFSETGLIVSGLPFTSLPREVTDSILSETEQALSPEGKFITFQYTLFKKKVFEARFNIVDTLFELRNLPSAFVLVMKRRK